MERRDGGPPGPAGGPGAGYPEDLDGWVARLREWERLRARAAERARDEGAERTLILPSRVIDFLGLALAGGVVGNLGYDLLRAALRAWRRPQVRLPDRARDAREAVLLAVLATQARCAQVGLPVPSLAELEASECARSPDRWRVELRRRDYGPYVRGERPWPDGVALGATVRIPDGPLDARDVAVTVVAKRDVDAAVTAEYERIRQFVADLDRWRAGREPG